MAQQITNKVTFEGYVVPDVKLKGEDADWIEGVLYLDEILERNPDGTPKESVGKVELVSELEKYAGKKIRVTIEVIR